VGRTRGVNVAESNDVSRLSTGFEVCFGGEGVDKRGGVLEFTRLGLGGDFELSLARRAIMISRAAAWSSARPKGAESSASAIAIALRTTSRSSSIALSRSEVSE
jgi:hypothetical protein